VGARVSRIGLDATGGSRYPQTWGNFSRNLLPIPLPAAPGYRVTGDGTRQEGRMREIS
jgi:hypothetical protein